MSRRGGRLDVSQGWAAGSLAGEGNWMQNMLRKYSNFQVRVHSVRTNTMRQCWVFILLLQLLAQEAAVKGETRSEAANSMMSRILQSWRSLREGFLVLT